MWYCAHAIFYFELKYEAQGSYLVHENVYLINAVDETAAMDEAVRVAKENQDLNEDDHLELNEKPVRYLFSGIRKLIAVGNYDKQSKDVIESGVEATYSELEVDRLEQVEQLSKGGFVDVLYRE